ncbi:MAG: hypothetical protein H7222_18200 [Methylotenera sp.]|nr:hypothetical protein [Oligoflexia bacterium]
MKYLNWTLAALITATAPTAFGDVQHIQIRGGDNQEVNLSSSEYHTIYATVQVPSTCYMTVQRGYIREELPPISRRVCDPVFPPRRERDEGRGHLPPPPAAAPQPNPCRTVLILQYREVPRYVQEPYSCLKLRTVAVGEQTDYFVSARVSVQSQLAPAGAQPNEDLAISLNGTSLSASSTSGTNSVILRGQLNASAAITRPEVGYDSMNGTAGEKQVTGTLALELYRVADVTSPAAGGINDLKFDGRDITFTVGKVMLPQFFSGHVSIERKRALWVDKKIADVDFNASTVELHEQGERTQVVIHASALVSEEIKSRSKYEIELRINNGSDGQMLNRQVIPADLRATQKTTFKM